MPPGLRPMKEKRTQPDSPEPGLRTWPFVSCFNENVNAQDLAHFSKHANLNTDVHNSQTTQTRFWPR